MALPGFLKSGFTKAQNLADKALKDAQQATAKAQEDAGRTLGDVQRRASKTFNDAQRLAQDAQQATVSGFGAARKVLQEGANDVVDNAMNAADSVSKRLEGCLFEPQATNFQLCASEMLWISRIPRFHHCPIEHENGIRLLTISPAVFTDDENSSLIIRCNMHHFNPENRPDYVALSYTWGGHRRSMPIFVDSKISYVRQNLFQFLLHARGETDRSAFYWIDALCIDQDNIPERNLVVPQMTNIYCQASHIRVWLGYGNKTLEAALESVDHLTRIHPFLPGARNAPVPVEDPYTRPDVAELKALITDPYWYRAWVLQEVSTPWNTASSVSSYTLVQYGRKFRFLDELMLALLKIHTHETEIVHREGPKGLKSRDRLHHLTRMKLFRFKAAVHQWPPLDMMRLLANARDSNASDPRDKVYSLQGIAVDGKDFKIDYGKSTRIVYTDLATTLIRRDKNLNILGFASGKSRLADLPSWVPDWTEPDVAEAFPKTTWTADMNETSISGQDRWQARALYDASKGMSSTVGISVEGKLLVVTGFVFDHVTSICLNDDEVYYAEGGPRAPYISGGSRWVALTHTLVADHFSCDEWTIERDASLPIMPQSMDKKVVEDLPGGGRNSSATDLAETVTGRSVIFTSKGYIGIGADIVNVGDLICIVEGARVPLVLRKHAENTDLLEFRGECYIHGIMDGEALQENTPSTVSEPELKKFRIQ